MGPHYPATAHFFGEAIEVGFLVAQTFEHFLGLGFDLGIVERIELGVGLHVLRAVHGASGFQFLEAFFEAGQFAGPSGGDLQNGFFTHGFALLREEADHGPRIPLDRPFIGSPASENDGEERGFARAVGTHQRHPIPVVDLEGGVFEQDPSGDGHLQLTDGKHCLE